jgi:hypothetical protein|tara:strand:+ start:339 stop:686 length:348 start_codon:yes stop_codon:yes gene_type:complete
VASTFKNQGATLQHEDTSAGNFYTAPGGTYSVIHALYLTNKSSTNIAKVDVKVTTDGGSTFYHIAKAAEIPTSNTLTMDKPINLEPSDILRLVAVPNPDSSSTEVEAFASILEVS